VGFIGSKPPQREKEHFDLYMEASRKGVAAIRPGKTMHDAYEASVKVFEEAGLGYPFIRTGHGLGLEGQELPDLMQGNKEKIRPGMVFAIEPFAVPSKEGGVIFNCEDNVECTETGPDLLSTPQKEIFLA
jgi:Xaa-Pro dipeptidase